MIINHVNTHIDLPEKAQEDVVMNIYFISPPFEWFTMSLNTESSFFNKFSGESNSATLPSSNTRILSESIIVFTRCAIVSTVQPLNASRIVA
mmetsp:Transcript_8088/g.16868  ORF Transcript_8088/g.16868 Transcript_8088/m.16868 type:complete len:92 (+) Transcript_8088:880-1155(+)